MKARIFEIKRFAVHDGDGIRTTVFFKGCPLRCVWCHNPEGLDAKPQLGVYQHKCVDCGACVNACPQNAHTLQDGKHTFDRSKCIGCGKCESACLNGALRLYGKEMTVDELLPLLLADREFYETTGGGVTLSGGECLLYAEFCAELLKRLKEEKIHTAVDTCGFVAKSAIDQVAPYTDVFLYDVKAFNEDVHIRCTGQSNKRILENLEYIDGLGKTMEIRIPYVPQYNQEEIQSIAGFLRKCKHVKKVQVLSYHNYAGSKYDALELENTLPKQLPSEEEVQSAQACVDVL